MDVLDTATLPEVLKKQRSIFVVGVRANSFWKTGIDAYPFHQGALLVHAPEDEMRYPTMFLHSLAGQLIIAQEPWWFTQIWNDHLAGIIDHSPPDFHLPEYARPHCELPVKW